MKKMLSGFAAVALAATSGAGEWSSGDLVVARGDTVTLNESVLTAKGLGLSGGTNSTLTIHGNFDVYLGQQNRSPQYSVGDPNTTTPGKISIGPDAGDVGRFRLGGLTMNAGEGRVNNDNLQAKVVIGENGGCGSLEAGTIESWKPAVVHIRSFELSANAATAADVFDVLAINYMSRVLFREVRNSNVKPMRIRFVNKDANGSQALYFDGIRSFWQSNNGMYDMPNEGGDIILEGGFVEKYNAPILIEHWGYDGGLADAIVKVGSKGKLRTVGDCDVILRARQNGRNGFLINPGTIVWGHRRDLRLMSGTEDSSYLYVGINGGFLRAGGEDVFPYGPETGVIQIQAAADRSPEKNLCLDLNGYSQKLNGLNLWNDGYIVAKGGETVTFGTGDANGYVSGSLTNENVNFVKTGAGTLTLSNATFKSLCVLGGKVKFAVGSVNAIETLAVTNAMVEPEPDATVTIGRQLLGEGAIVGVIELPSSGASNVLYKVGSSADYSVVTKVVKKGGNYLTYMTPPDAHGAELQVRGGVLRMGGAACANAYWRFVAKQTCAPPRTFTVAKYPEFSFTMRLGLGSIGMFTAEGLYALGYIAGVENGLAPSELPASRSTSANPPTAWNKDIFHGYCPDGGNDPVLGGGTTYGQAEQFASQGGFGHLSDPHYDQRGTSGSDCYISSWTGGLVYEGTRPLDPNDSSTWEMVAWRNEPSWAANPPTSYALRRLVNNDYETSPNVSGWELQSSPDGLVWETMDVRSNQTFNAVNGLSSQFNYTDHQHVPYLFSAKNASWKFDNFGAIEVAAGATLDLTELRPENVAIRALRVDCAGAGAIMGFRPAENGALYLTTDASAFKGDQLIGRLVLPLTVTDCSDMERLATWTIFVDGQEAKDSSLLFVDGQIVVRTPRGMMMLLR